MKEQLRSICLYTDDGELRRFTVGTSSRLSGCLLSPAALSRLVMGCCRWRSCRSGGVFRRRRSRAWLSSGRWRSWARCRRPATLPQGHKGQTQQARHLHISTTRGQHCWQVIPDRLCAFLLLLQGPADGLQRASCWSGAPHPAGGTEEVRGPRLSLEEPSAGLGEELGQELPGCHRPVQTATLRCVQRSSWPRPRHLCPHLAAARVLVSSQT